MYLLFETIRLQDGELQNLEYHESRLNTSRKELFQVSDKIVLYQQIAVPEDCKQGIFKCKVVYGIGIQYITFEPYIARKIKSLRLVEDNTITYNFKYTDRDRLDELLIKRGECDEILIVKNGFVTDTSFSNIVFYDGSDWVTPTTPLLHGIMRSYLLDKKYILAKEIKLSNIKVFQKARLINAMLPLDNGIDISVANIW